MYHGFAGCASRPLTLDSELAAAAALPPLAETEALALAAAVAKALETASACALAWLPPHACTQNREASSVENLMTTGALPRVSWP
jgi:hypothetical protein